MWNYFVFISCYHNTFQVVVSIMVHSSSNCSLICVHVCVCVCTHVQMVLTGVIQNLKACRESLQTR